MKRFLFSIVGLLVLGSTGHANKPSLINSVAPTVAAGEEYYVNIREGSRLGWYSLRREANGYRFKFLDTRHNERQGTLPISDVLFIQSKFLGLPTIQVARSTRSCARRHVQISVNKNGLRTDRDRCLKDLTTEETELLSVLERATTRLQ